MSVFLVSIFVDRDVIAVEGFVRQRRYCEIGQFNEATKCGASLTLESVQEQQPHGL
jgi:hypothetical protein